ncbi:MAG: formimidoylglutamate deiminase [Bdellovibrionales bacterium]|nr:formimidoylglutamate deiminase [Bdellovibrionales bacterium]
MSSNFVKYRGVYTESGWFEDAIVELDNQGNLLCLHAEAPHPIHDSVAGWALPGFYNGHSHAFQYALGGRVESLAQGKESDDFWSWRERMYQVAQTIDLESLKTLAMALYKEMYDSGYRQVTEFHYLHHKTDGHPFSEKAAMAEALVYAATEVGLKISVVPVYYRNGGFGLEARREQIRFLSKSLDDYRQLVSDVENICSKYPGASWGVGVHSLRAADPHEIQELFSSYPRSVVKHIHIAEQIAEVDECLQKWGQRPVEWLLNHVEVDQSFALVHATQLNQQELEGIVASKATVVICPTTEANLGDGFFPFLEYQNFGGAWTIGSDSQATICPFEELRFLDYGQRLLHRKRNIVCRQGGDESGEILYRQAQLGGQRAAGVGEPCLGFKIGEPFRPVILNGDEVRFQNLQKEQLLSAAIFSPGRKPLLIDPN